MTASSAAEAVVIKSDPFLLEIIRNYLRNTCREMGVAMMRTSYSPMFNEALDFSCVLFDSDLEMIAQANFCPAHIGATVHWIPAAIKEIGAENLNPGDIIFTNDPYRAGAHLPEFLCIKPFFHKGEIKAYSANIAHMTDIGGMVPAAFGDHQNTFQEGIRFPPLKLYEGDTEKSDIFRIMISNVRTPKSSYGDMKAMIGSLYLADRRLEEIIEHYGLETFQQCCKDSLDVSETLMRQQIAKWPNGEYLAEGIMEDDGVVPGKQWAIRATLVVRDDEIIVDYTGSDPAEKGPGNQSFGCTASASYNGILQMVEGDIPYNGGCYRPLTIIAPPGTMVNAVYPSSTVAGNSDTHPTSVDVVLRAFAQFSDRSSAADGGTCGCIGFGGIDAKAGGAFAHLHLEGVGWGGREDADGNDALFVKNGNCANTPVEVAETRYPLINMEYALDVNGCGHGKHRGGYGTRRVFRFIGDEVEVSAHTNRHIVRPWGLKGGLEGSNTQIKFRRNGERNWQGAREMFGTVSPGKFSNLVMYPGDEMLFITPCGGGYGDPLERDPDLVRQDVFEDDLMSLDTAREVYGVVLDPATRTVDESATRVERETRCSGAEADLTRG